MDVKSTPILEVQIKFSADEAARVSALATREGITTDELLHRAIEAFLAIIVENENLDQNDWQGLGLAAFERDWNNSEDAVYDEWRKHYGVESR